MRTFSTQIKTPHPLKAGRNFFARVQYFKLACTCRYSAVLGFKSGAQSPQAEHTFLPWKTSPSSASPHMKLNLSQLVSVSLVEPPSLSPPVKLYNISLFSHHAFLFPLVYYYLINLSLVSLSPMKHPPH